MDVRGPKPTDESAATRRAVIDDDRGADGGPDGDAVTTGGTIRSRPAWVLPFGFVAFVGVIISNLSGIATGDDGVGYRAIADSLLDGRGFGYFLENPVTVWPPIWPSLLYAVAKVTPLDTLGAAVALNAVTIFAAVLVGNRLLRRLVADDRLVMAGTAVIGLGPLTAGFGHLLMTDYAFAVLILAWMLTLMRFRDTGAMQWLIAAALWVWVGFGLRYVGIALIGTGGLWLLLDGRRSLRIRFRNGVIYGATSVVVPIAWMLRNRSIDGTLTGERFTSGRGLARNVLDTLATLGKMILPGVLNGSDTMWSIIGGAALVVGAALGWKVLTARDVSGPSDTPVRRFVRMLGGPVGLVLMHVGIYVAYMVYVRTTTALNVLDLRLLNAAYFGTIVLAMVLADRLEALGPASTNPWFGRARVVTGGWAVVNVAIGLVAIVGFAGGNSFFAGNYENETFTAVRASAALQAIPDGCHVYSNLPNSLYPTVESRWAPRRTGMESFDRTDDLEKLIPTLDERPACLVWIDKRPVFGNVWSREDLGDRLDLVEIATDDANDLSVYRMDPPRS